MHKINTMKYDSLLIEKKEYVLLKRLMNLSGQYMEKIGKEVGRGIGDREDIG